MSSRDRHLAGVWQAFAAGMFAESCIHSAKFIDEQNVTPEQAREQFLENCTDAMFALAVPQADALKSYEAGRKLMQEIQDAGEQKWNPLEDGPPLMYTGPERQLTGKPNRRLS